MPHRRSLDPRTFTAMRMRPRARPRYAHGVPRILAEREKHRIRAPTDPVAAMRADVAAPAADQGSGGASASSAGRGPAPASPDMSAAGFAAGVPVSIGQALTIPQNSSAVRSAS